MLIIKKYYINIFKLSALKGIIYLFYDNIYTCEMKLILRNIFSFTGKTDNIKWQLVMQTFPVFSVVNESK